MQDSKIELVSMKDIDANPFRLLGDYPYSTKKLEALQRSIKDVGLWEGIIGRRKGNRIEIAFGHHRQKAGEMAKLTHIPVIVRDLSDEQMLQFMGRENLEEYNAEFLIMLETWEAGHNFPGVHGKQREAIDIAKLLGWTEVHHSGSAQLNYTARACHAAFALINAGHLVRADLSSLSVRSAHDIVERAHSRVQQIDKWALQNKVSKPIVEQEKKHVSGAARDVAKQIRGGTVSPRDIKTKVDMQAFGRQVKADRNPSVPRFGMFGKSLADQIQRMLSSDSAGEKLREISNVLQGFTPDHEEDIRTLKLLDFELENLGDRVVHHRRNISLKKGKNVTPLRAIE